MLPGQGSRPLHAPMELAEGSLPSRAPRSSDGTRRLGTGSPRNPFRRLSVPLIIQKEKTGCQRAFPSASCWKNRDPVSPDVRIIRAGDRRARTECGCTYQRRRRRWRFGALSKCPVTARPVVLQEEEEEEQGERERGREGGGRCLSLCAQGRRIPGPKFKFKRKGETGCNRGRQLRIRGR